LRLIVGLGNPGAAYALTRHNIGVRILQRAAARWGIPLSHGDTRPPRHGRLEAADVALAAPLSWMNESGPAVKTLLDALTLTPSDLIVLHDDLDLPLGRLRIKRRGGPGGHNGVLSVLLTLETDEFTRVKFGIGRPAPEQDPADYVLAPFAPEETAAVDAAVDRAVDALHCLVVEGLDAAMNRYNPKEVTGDE
jgi:PTH1 family peptidyl-tRNA hydrolase